MKKLFCVFAILHIAALAPIFAQRGMSPAQVFGGVDYTIYARSYNEQDGYALVQGHRLHYWLYDTITNHGGDASELYNRIIPKWVEDTGYVIDFDNIKVYDPNPNLATSVRALMRQRGCDISVALVTRESGNTNGTDYVVINEYFSDDIYKTTIYYLYKGDTSVTTAQDNEIKQIFQTRIFGETRTLYEYRNGNQAYLKVEMRDNNEHKYDSETETAIVITTGWYADQNSYDKARQDAIDFLNSVMVYFEDVPDVCELSPCCTLVGRKRMTYVGSNDEYLHIEYKCADIDMLSTISGGITAYGPNSKYLFEKYNVTNIEGKDGHPYAYWGPYEMATSKYNPKIITVYFFTTWRQFYNCFSTVMKKNFRSSMSDSDLDEVRKNLGFVKVGAIDNDVVRNDNVADFMVSHGFTYAMYISIDSNGTRELEVKRIYDDYLNFASKEFY